MKNLNNSEQVKRLKNELQQYASEERKKINKKFFKTGQGEYGEGDEFIGVRVPDARKVAKQFSKSSFQILGKLLESKIHEERLLSLLILKEQNKRALKNEDKKKQKEIVEFYLKNKKRINNWDLVDLSAHYILGQAILRRIENKNMLNKLVVSKSMWDRRIAIITTLVFIQEGDISTTLILSKKLLADQEDLMHKAVGWMLREAWKKDSQKVESFLMKNYHNLSRTTLRYAIERMPGKQRKIFLKGEFKIKDDFFNSKNKTS
jgi:3-methyladenine DNA glycosylase AlkD